jgi:dipeptidyl aminopeptidase/acylaminoacyl peptidase
LLLRSRYCALAEDQTVPDFTIHDGLALNELPGRLPIDLSGDGRWLAYTTKSHTRQETSVGGYTRNGVPEEVVQAVIWVTDVDHGRTHCLTPDWGSSWAPRWSPDGKRLAFFSDKNGKPHLFVWNRETDQMQSFPAAIARPFFEFEVPKWSPDGSLVFYKALPRGQPLSFISEPEQKRSWSQGAFVDVWRSNSEGEEANDRPENLKRTPALPNGRTQPTDVAVAVVETGRVHRLMCGYSIRSLDVSPDGKQVAVVGNYRPEAPGVRQANYDLFVLPVPALSKRSAAGGRRWEPLLPGLRLGSGICVSWSPDSNRLAYTTHGGLTSGDVLVIEIADGTLRNLTEERPADTGSRPQRLKVDGAELPSFASEYDPPLWTKDGASLLCVGGGDLWMLPSRGDTPRNLTQAFSRQIGSIVRDSEGYTAWTARDGELVAASSFGAEPMKAGFCLISLRDGTVVPLLEEERSVLTGRFMMDVAEQTGVMVYAVQSGNTPADLWRLDLSSRSAHPVTRVNPHLRPGIFPMPQVIEWKTEDGQTLKGVLRLPPTATLENRVPMVAWVYPGLYPSQRIKGFDWVPALFTSRGYAVLHPDIPRTGHEPAADIARAVIPALNAVVATGKIDGERLGVFGHSSGGYTVNVLITRTNRFAAAVSCQGYCDLAGLYLSGGPAGPTYQSWIETSLMGGTPWDHPDRYVRNSPVFYLHKVSTPLLLIYGENDPGFPEQSWEIYHGLVRLGKEVALASYKNADHYYGTWSTGQIVDFWERVLSWFDEHLVC